ncbi:hypothetical protein ACV229_21890 [Burkholderia sp. MR1-5-21]
MRTRAPGDGADAHGGASLARHAAPRRIPHRIIGNRVRIPDLKCIGTATRHSSDIAVGRILLIKSLHVFSTPFHLFNHSLQGGADDVSNAIRLPERGLTAQLIQPAVRVGA